MKGRPFRELEVAGLLLLLPLLALAPALVSDTLLGPGDGAALHFPLRAEVWDAWRAGELPLWNRSQFGGTPLLAAYRPGAFYPPMLALAPLDPFDAFQLLVLLSLAAAGLVTYFYLRRLGAGTTGSYVAGLGYALGPYLAGHLGHTDTIVAAPLLPLVLLAAESHMNRATAGRAAGLSAALALLLLAGSPAASRAGVALVVGRLLLGHLRPHPGGPSGRHSAIALGLGMALAAPQLLPSLLALPEAGRQVTGLADGEAAWPGFAGLIVRYVSHTPAPALALAALPLVLTHMAVRVLGLALLVCLWLQWGSGPLAEPGALALVFDFALAVLCGLSLSVQWRARHEPLGARLRAYFLFAALCSSAALSVAAAATGPLPESLSGAVGVLAFALIVYFATATHRNPLFANVWLLPLTASFLLQPYSRGAWTGAPTRALVYEGTATRRAVEAAMGAASGELALSLARDWPGDAAFDLGHGGFARFTGQRSASGYDPMVPLRTRAAFEGMGPDGTLREAFFRTSPARLEALGVRWALVETEALQSRADAWGLGEPLDLELSPDVPRFFPLPLQPASELRIASHLAEALEVEEGTVVATAEVRLASGRTIALPLRAGEHTAEWAHDRPDVRARIRHGRAPVLESWPAAGAAFLGYRYLATLPLSGRFLVDGVRLVRSPGSFRFQLSRLSLRDAARRRFAPASLVSAWLSDSSRLHEVASTPGVRLFALPDSLGPAAVLGRVRVIEDEAARLRALADPPGAGFDPRREALVAALPPGFVPGDLPRRAILARAAGGRLEVLAEGPGLLVLAESWDRGWSATVDGAPGDVVQANLTRLAVALSPGWHRVVLHYAAPGFAPGVALSLLAVVVLATGLGFDHQKRRALRSRVSPSIGP